MGLSKKRNQHLAQITARVKNLEKSIKKIIKESDFEEAKGRGDFWDEHEDPQSESSSDEANFDKSSLDERSSDEESSEVDNGMEDNTQEGLGDNDGEYN